ncbi:acetylxylan esterase [Paratractidigestivibacter sp.]|uniref:acetylxylan esterase n=1 Tax=Paratractidigestivibacter sp. TaxID=2847316 RepID=UPI002AC93406|nr:acetylxylan esterase [Paratractidigestivibacter sp.]
MADFESWWRERAKAAEKCAAGQTPCLSDVGVQTPVADYREMRYVSLDGSSQVTRVIVPRAAGPHPCILVWHDLDRGTRGWFQLSRYVAAGYAVVHPAYRSWSGDLTAGWQDGPEGLKVACLVEDTLVACALARGLKGVDGQRLMTHGEGFGSLFALAAAALAEGVVKCAVVNAMPAKIESAWREGAAQMAYQGVWRHFREQDPCAEHAAELFSALAYVDAAEFAALLPASCELLDGVCLMDEVAPPATQRALFDRADCKKQIVTYPKFGHERLNDFENRLLSFMHFGERSA